MTSLESNRIPSTAVLDQVLVDLNQELAPYRDKKLGIRKLSLRMGLHSKTLDRLFQGKHQPSYQTLLKIYSYLHKTDTIELLFNLIPPVIADEIKKMRPNKAGNEYSDPLAVEELHENIVALGIYVLCGAGSLSSQQIKKKFGQYGVDSLLILLKLGLLEEGPKNNFKVSRKQIQLEPQLLLKISQFLLKSFFRSECAELKTENYISFVTDSISEEAYQALLTLERHYMDAKIKILDDPKNAGSLRYFSIQVSDKILMDESDQIPSTLKTERFLN